MWSHIQFYNDLVITWHHANKQTSGASRFVYCLCVFLLSVHGDIIVQPKSEELLQWLSKQIINSNVVK